MKPQPPNITNRRTLRYLLSIAGSGLLLACGAPAYAIHDGDKTVGQAFSGAAFVLSLQAPGEDPELHGYTGELPIEGNVPFGLHGSVPDDSTFNVNGVEIWLSLGGDAWVWTSSSEQTADDMEDQVNASASAHHVEITVGDVEIVLHAISAQVAAFCCTGGTQLWVKSTVVEWVTINGDEVVITGAAPQIITLPDGQGELVLNDWTKTWDGHMASAVSLNAARVTTTDGAEVIIGSIEVGILCHVPEVPDDGVGTRTPGYWQNHPDAWPVEEIDIGGETYSKEEAIEIMSMPPRGDVTLIMFAHLVAAKLNVLNGTDDSCIADTIADADDWMMTHGPAGSNVRARGTAWRDGEPLKNTLDNYNNGLMCAPKAD